MRQLKILDGGVLWFVLVFLVAIIQTVVFVVPASSLSQAQRDVIDSGILYYDLDVDQCSVNNSGTNNSSNELYFIGDSLTVGMNSDSLGENSLQNKLVEAGFSPNINGQGCRPLYNSTSPQGFEGDGSSCPLGTITSAFNEFEKDKDKIASAGTIVIALGTNKYEGSEEVFIEKGIEYINLIKAENGSIGNRIFWVNTYIVGDGRADRSSSIDQIVQSTGIQLIDYRAAAIANPTAHSFPSNDNTHNDSNGYINKTNLILDVIGDASPQQSVGGYDPLSLTFPNFPDEQAIVNGIESTVSSRYPQSPWIGKAQWIVDKSRENNVNPLFVVATGGVESAFGDSPRGRSNNNYFGIGKGNRQFASPEEGILYFIEVIPKYISGEEAPVPRYKHIKNIYDYTSVHQVGGIYYPGINEEQSPAPDTGAPMPILDSFESGGMGVYVSWDITDHPNDKYDGQLFNPLAYYKINVQIINEVTGLEIPDEPTLGVASNISAGCGGDINRSGVAGANGWDLPGEGPNPMTYYSQRRNGNDDAVQGYFGNDAYGTGTISACGCGPTSFAMIVTTLTGSETTPTEVADWAASNGHQGSGCGSNWWWTGSSAVESEAKWGVKARQIQLAEAEAEIRKGNLIIMSAGPGSVMLSPGGNGHLLVMRAVTDDGRYLFADPSDGPSKNNAYPVLSELGSSRTPLDAATVSNGLKALFAVEKVL